MTDLEIFNDYLKVTNSIVGIADIVKKKLKLREKVQELSFLLRILLIYLLKNTI